MKTTWEAQRVLRSKRNSRCYVIEPCAPLKGARASSWFMNEKPRAAWISSRARFDRKQCLAHCKRLRNDKVGGFPFRWEPPGLSRRYHFSAATILLCLSILIDIWILSFKAWSFNFYYIQLKSCKFIKIYDNSNKYFWK